MRTARARGVGQRSTPATGGKEGDCHLRWLTGWVGGVRCVGEGEGGVVGDETWGKRSAQSHGVAIREESENGGQSRWQVRQWLTSRWGENGRRRRKLWPSTLFIGVGERRLSSGPTCQRRQAGPTRTWCTLVPSASVGIAHPLSVLKPTWATIPYGPAHSIERKMIFQLFQLQRVCKIKNALFFCSKIFQTLHECILTHYEHCSFCKKVQILGII
jgi:hypothetical protein